MNNIEIDLNILSEDTRKFIDNTIFELNAQGIKVSLENSAYVSGSTLNCTGSFDEQQKLLCVGCEGNEIDHWLQIFVHESCHADQFIEKSPFYVSEVNGYNASMTLDMWLSNAVELNDNQLRDVLKWVVEVELDCEKRTVEKIKKYNLPIDVKRYTQLANGYIYSYFGVVSTRRWFTPGKGPAHTEDITYRMPDHFDNDYTKIDSQILDLYLEKCFNTKIRTSY